MTEDEILLVTAFDNIRYYLKDAIEFNITGSRVTGESKEKFILVTFPLTKVTVLLLKY